MGRFIDLNSPLSEEDRAYLKSRGRGYLLAANERRFGTPDNPREPEEHEKAGAPAQSPFYDTQERDKAVYDTGGAPLPGATLDYNTGRAYDRDNGVLVEPAQAGHTPGAYGSRYDSGEVFEEGDEDNSDIDEDIAEKVTSLGIRELEAELKEKNIPVPTRDELLKQITGVNDPNELHVNELLDCLTQLEVQTEKGDKKEDLVKRLNAKGNQLRKDRMQDLLAIHLQDERDGKS